MIMYCYILLLQVDDDSFEILLEYLEGLKGKSREVTVSEAENVIEKSETEDEGLCPSN